MSSKSYYELEFSVAPGGARKDTHYLRGTMEEIKADLAEELAKDVNLYLLCWYGADLLLHVWQNGERAESIDLHPFVTISIDGYPDITFTGPESPVGYDFEAEEEAAVEEGSLSDRMVSSDLGDAVSTTVDWERITVPPLVGQLMAPDDAGYGWGDSEV
jgi:hypothetical protein